MRYIKLIFIGFILFAQNTVMSQDSIVLLNLESVLILAGADNLNIESLSHKYEMSVAKHKATKEWIIPSIYIGVQTHNLTGAAMNSDGRIFTDVGQASFWGGLGLDLQWDFTQSIYQSKAAKQRILSTEYFNQAEKNRIILDIVHLYFDLQAEQSVYVALQEIQSQITLFAELLDIQVRAGEKYESDFLLAKSNINHTKIKISESITKINDYQAKMANYLNIDRDSRLIIGDTLFVPIDLGIPVTNAEDWYSQRPEYAYLSNEIKVIALENRQFTTGILLPKFRLNTYDSYFGRPFAPLYNTFAFQTSLTWNIPLGTLIFKGNQEKNMARTYLKQVQLKSLENLVNEEVLVARNRIGQAVEQIGLAEESLGFTQAALDQNLGRQRFKTATAFEIFQSQEYHIRAKLDYIQAVKKHNKAQYDLYIASGNNF